MDARSVAEVDAATVDAFRRGDEEAFDRISRHHFRELHVHCYRMLGSFDDAEDAVQDTLLRAWRHRHSYEGRATVRAWLYRIATNACIDAIRRRAPSSDHIDVDPVAKSATEAAAIEESPQYARFPWMQPYPDALLDGAGADADPPDARLVVRETIELAFLATIQLLPPKQRAVLILRDVLDFSAAETADVLDDSTAAVNSALQRARATVRARRAPDPGEKATFGDVILLQAYMDAAGRGDIDAIVDLLREDVRMMLLPEGRTWEGRHEVRCELLERRNDFGDARVIAIAANRQPAIAVYRRHAGDAGAARDAGDAGDAEYRAWAIVVLGVAEGKVREIATFASPELFSRFGLPLAVSS